MGTNYYLMTKDKQQAQKYAPYSYELTDEPYFGYEIHIAKCSCGWLPLFQAHKEGITSVKEYKEAYDDGCEICDEYGRQYNWEEFTEQVLQHNGGIRGAIPLTFYEQDKSSLYRDLDMPDHIPVSHFEYGNGKYAEDYLQMMKDMNFVYNGLHNKLHNMSIKSLCIMSIDNAK